MNVKPGLYFARKGQDVPRWMWEVTGGNSDTVTDYKFKTNPASAGFVLI